MNLFIQEAEFRTIVSHYQSYIKHITAYISDKTGTVNISRTFLI